MWAFASFLFVVFVKNVLFSQATLLEFKGFTNIYAGLKGYTKEKMYSFTAQKHLIWSRNWIFISNIEGIVIYFRI